MQFPRINQNSGAGADLKPSGLAAFYTRAGEGSGSSAVDQEIVYL